MRLRLLLATLLTGLVAAVPVAVTAAPAVAAPYPPVVRAGAVTASVVAVGDSVLFSGRCPAVAGQVAVAVNGSPYASTATHDGTFAVRVGFTSSGQKVLTAACTGSARVVTSTVLVRSAAAGAALGTTSGTTSGTSGTTSGGLPFTGAEIGLLSAAALAFIFGGVAVRFSARRRSSRPVEGA